MIQPGPMFWLLDVHLYDYNTGVLKQAEVTGRVLILSRQLWSLLREDTVYSVLIGPGVFRGTAVSGNKRSDIIEPISILMFDPTRLRPDEPLPLVDIVNPEVIDPLETDRYQEIVTYIRKVVIEKGNVLSAGMILRHHPEASVPTTAHVIDLASRINVRHVSGEQRARFVLAGTNGPLYKSFVQTFQTRARSMERMKIMATPFNRFALTNESGVVDGWMIVEKAGFDTSVGLDALMQEYEATLGEVMRNKSKFIYDA
ncbi:MAG: hypothetical protein QXS20_08975 [Candidatus Thorarchaeota archaeon]